MARKKSYNVIGHALCTTRQKYRASVQLSSVVDVKATTKAGAIRSATRKWRARGEWPVADYKHRARCVLRAHAEEV